MPVRGACMSLVVGITHISVNESNRILSQRRQAITETMGTSEKKVTNCPK